MDENDGPIMQPACPSEPSCPAHERTTFLMVQELKHCETRVLEAPGMDVSGGGAAPWRLGKTTTWYLNIRFHFCFTCSCFSMVSLEFVKFNWTDRVFIVLAYFPLEYLFFESVWTFGGYWTCTCAIISSSLTVSFPRCLPSFSTFSTYLSWWWSRPWG